VRRFALVPPASGGISLLCALLGVTACWRNQSEMPPVHLNQNMDLQEKGEAQERNQWFTDGRVMRTPPAGTVAVGFLKDDDHMHRGLDLEGHVAAGLPEGITLDEALLARGEQRYNIYCAPCHGMSGRGDGIATRRGGGFAVAPGNFHKQELQPAPLGYFYRVMTYGIRTMRSYQDQITSPEDRWAIAAWVRVLQQSHRAKEGDVPSDALGQQARRGQ
jgi:mono/diheme cytochrome c family protein